MHRRTQFRYALIAALPLLLSPLLLIALAEGWLNPGGGEKDILLIFPYFIWALVFFICAAILIFKQWSLGRWVKRSAVVSAVFMLVLAFVAYGISWMGIA